MQFFVCDIVTHPCAGASMEVNTTEQDTVQKKMQTRKKHPGPEIRGKKVESRESCAELAVSRIQSSELGL